MLDDIDNAYLTLDGEAGDDTLKAYDSGDTKANTGTLSATQLTGLGMTLGIQYTASSTSSSRSRTGDDTFFVDSTPAGSDLTLHTGNEAPPTANQFNDVVNIASIGGADDGRPRRRQRRRPRQLRRATALPDVPRTGSAAR